MGDTTSDASLHHLHDEDLFHRSQEQAKLLEERRFDELDLIDLVDEVRALGASEKREIRDRLAVSPMHLLEWRHQPGRRPSSWERTIVDRRSELAEVLAIDPSLRGYPGQVFERAFDSARLQAARETGLDLTLFPTTPPFTPEQAPDPRFLPRHPDDAPSRTCH